MKKRRPRTVRRGELRATEKLAAARERLFELEPGGSAERPIEIATAAVVEAQAESLACPRCSGRHELEEHLAVTLRGVRLRQARLRCRQCGSRRSLWFRIADLGPN